MLCFLGYLLLDLWAARYRADDPDFFSCISPVSRLHFERSDEAGRQRSFEERDGRFLIDGPWIAEPIGGANGDEPVSPVAIATSVAAHPRRSPFSLGRRATSSLCHPTTTSA